MPSAKAIKARNRKYYKRNAESIRSQSRKQSKSKVVAAVKPAAAALSFRTANAASTSKLAPSKPNAGASSVTKDSAAGEPLAEKCAVCEQIVVEGKDEALYCEGICQRW